MGQAYSGFIQSLVTEEIRRIVAQAIERGSTISSAGVAAEINCTYPNCGLTEHDIAEQVVIAAAKAGVAVEIGGDKIKADAEYLPVRRRFPTSGTLRSATRMLARDALNGVRKSGRSIPPDPPLQIPK